MSLKSMPRNVIILGIVSLFMDVSSEMIHSVLPVFMVSVLGTSAMVVGIVEGVGEATASITKIFSGVISDWIGRRKPLVLIGYGLAAFSKPLFPLAQSAAAVLLARFVDRVGKGIRGAPRDALIADVVTKEQLGAAFGLRQAMDTVGAFIGPILALLLMFLTSDNYRAVFWAAFIPGVVAILCIVFGVEEPEAQSSVKKTFPIRKSELAKLPVSFWGVVAIAAAFTLARFSEAFLLLRASGLGLSAGWMPMIFILMNVIYAAAAYPIGALSDRIGRGGLLATGIALLIVADVLLAFGDNLVWVFAGVAIWGLHLGMTEGLLSALVAGAAPPELRGTAFGMYNLLTGIVALIASGLAGLFWTAFGPDVTFTAGALFATLSLIGLRSVGRKYLK